MAMTSGLFDEPTPQQVAHSAASLHLRNSPHTRTCASWECDISMPTATAMAAAQTKWPRSLGRAHTAYSLANGTELPFFDHLAQLPERKARFGDLMKAVNSLPGLDVKHTLTGFDWQSLGEATIVDVSNIPYLL